MTEDNMNEQNPFDPTIPANPRVARRAMRKRVLTPREPIHEPVHSKPNKRPTADLSRWEGFDPENAGSSADRLHIPKDMIPDGIDYQWVTDSILGQPAPQRRAQFEKAGWLPVPASRHDGMFTPKGHQGEIMVDGLVLMERPLEFSLRAKQVDKRAAMMQVRSKEAQLTGGNIPGVTLDTQHQSAVRQNRINKSYEGFVPPNDD